MKNMGTNMDRPGRPSGREMQRMTRRITGRLLCGLMLVGVTAVSTHALLSKPTLALAEPQKHELSRDGLITHMQVLGDGTQQLCVLDPRQRVVAVYHIESIQVFLEPCHRVDKQAQKRAAV